MPHRFDDGAGVTPDGATVIVADGRDSLSVPGDFDLLHGDFSRDGGDLVVVAPDGARLTVADYFDSESPPDLVTANGATLSADLVTRLAGPMAPGQYAQLATDAGGAEAIGTVDSVEGAVYATRADGTRVLLQAGDAVFQGDIIETGAEGRIALVFIDGTTLSMADDARMVLDELIYDASSGVGSMVLTAVTGLFALVSGDIAAVNPGAATINTPVATIGVRGTSILFRIGPDGDLTVTLREDGDGTVGEIEITGAFGAVVLNQIGEVRTQGAADQEPVVVRLDEAAIFGLFGGDLAREILQSAYDAQARFIEEQIEDTVPEAGGDANDTGDMSGDRLTAEYQEAGLDEGVDTNTGGTGDDTLDGGTGNDTLTGGDTLDGGTGNDTTGNDTTGDPDGDTLGGGDTVFIESPQQFTGGGGDDVFTGGAAGDTIDGFGGGDTLSGAGGDDTITGGTGSDSIDGGTGNDVLSGDAGNDTLSGGAGTDTLSGGDGGDVLSGGLGADFLSGGAGADSISDGDGDDTLLGNAGNDTLIGDSGIGNDVIDGGADNDSLLGEAANDTLLGGAGSDTLSGGTGDDLLSGDGGLVGGGASGSTVSQTVTIAGTGETGSVAYIFFTIDTDTAITITTDGPTIDPQMYLFVDDGSLDAEDFLATDDDDGSPAGSFFNSIIDTGDEIGMLPAGSYIIAVGDFFLSEADAVDGINDSGGSTGDVTVTFEADSATITLTEGGTGGTIDLTGGAGDGNDVLDGGEGNDTLLGNGGDDILLGGAGDDTLIGGAGIDTLLGGDGNDLLVGDDVLIANILVDSTLFGTDANSLFGGAGDDTLVGADGNDLLDGGANDDTLLGGAGDDTVLGGDGNDLIIAGDFVLQEAPDDTLVFDAFGAGVGITVDLTDTGGQLISSEYGTDTISGIEAVVGTGLDDALFGGAGDETLVGSAGNDLLVGGGGNDLLLGGANDDTLMIADANFNVVDGGTGADLLVFDGSFDLDITLLAGEGLIGLEEFDITGTANNTLTLTADNVVDMSDTDTLTVNGDAGDSIDAGAGWTDTDTVIIGGQAYSVYTQGKFQGTATLIVNDAIDQSGVGVGA